MMSIRAAPSSGVRRVGGGFAASANIVSKDGSATMTDNEVNAADIPVGDEDSGPLTNLFNDSDAVDLDVPDGMRVAIGGDTIPGACCGDSAPGRSLLLAPPCSKNGHLGAGL